MSSTALDALRERLRRAHRDSGEISTREISKRTHGAVSHTTVSQVLKCVNLPRWRSLEAVIEAIGIDSADFKPLWIRARDEQDTYSRDSPKPVILAKRYDSYDEPESAGVISLARLLRKNGEEEKSKRLLLFELERYQNSLRVGILVELRHLDYSAYNKYVGQHPEKIENYLTRATDFDIEGFSANLWAAQECLDRGYVDRALYFVHFVRSIDPSDGYGLKIHGQALFEMGRYAEAEPLLLRAYEVRRPPIELDPEISTLARVLIFNDKIDKLEELAREAYQREVEADQRVREHRQSYLEDATAAYVRVLIIRGKPEEAEDVMRRFIESISDASTASLYLPELARIIAYQGRFDEAARILKESSEYESKRSFQIQYAQILAHAGDHKTSLTILSDLFQFDDSASNNDD